MTPYGVVDLIKNTIMEDIIKKTLKKRIEDISELIFEVANGNFDYTIDPSGEDDELDAIIYGVNMLGQELKTSTVSVNHMQSMYDGVIDMMIVMDTEMNIKTVNDAYTQFTEKTGDQVSGKHLGEIIDLSENRDLLIRINKQLDSTGKFQNAEILFKTETGSIPTSSSFSCLRCSKGKIEGIMIVAKDITKIKETEQKLIEAKDAAEEANLSKGRFLSNMSHEIRTPLNGIIGFTDMLKTTNLDEDQGEYVEMISNSGSNLSKLLNDVLDLNKIDLDRLTLEEISYDFKATFTSNLNPYTYTAKEKSIEFTYSFDNSIPKIVIGDPTRLNQVLVNLVGNAIKFTEKGEVSVHFSTTTKDGEQFLSCSVTDTGIGIPLEKQSLVFDQFTQSDNSITRKYGGSGLGLAISRQLIELMEGEIGITSPPIGKENGTTFHFQVPLKVGKEVEIETTQNKDYQFEDVKILAVDDNKVNLVLLERMLSKVGIIVTTAMDGQEAIKKAHSEEFDLVLMDIQMPVMDGLTAARTLRKSDYQKPILALSANVDTENITRITAAGMNDFLQKPFHRPDLMKLLKKWAED